MERLPFVGLLPFAVEESAYFFGRDREKELVAANLRSARLTILYGPTGVGKTSLLNAGVLSELFREAGLNQRLRGKPGIVPLRFASWRDDPVVGLSDAIYAAAKALWGVVPREIETARNDLRTLLLAFTKAKFGDLLIILDQFEEFFLYRPSSETRKASIEALAPVMTDPEIAANFLIAVREEWLPALDVWKGHLPGLFENYLRVRKLNYLSACAAIEMPVARYNEQFGTKIAIEPSLVNAVLARCHKVPHRGSKLIERSQAISVLRRWSRLPAPVVVPSTAELEHEAFETPAIQLIMNRLWKEEIGSGSSALRLQTLESLSRDRDIVDEHVYLVMKSLGTGQRSTAAVLIDRLVTPSGTKIAQTFGNLADYARVRPEKLEAVLTKLCSPTARILNSVAPPPGVDELCYEVAHDTLAVALSRWQSEHAWKRKVFRVSALACTFALLFLGTAGFAVYASRQTEKAKAAWQALATEKRHSKEVQEKLDAFTAGLKELPRPIGTSASEQPKTQPNTVTSPPTLAVVTTRLWRPGSVVRIRYRRGIPAVQEKITKYGSEWMQYANIRFEFGFDPDSEIRIGFEQNIGTWSFLGTDALHIPKDRETSNFDGFTPDTPELEIARTARHEFGHILGLIHELNQPNADIPWDREKVYQYFLATSGWAKAEVDAYIFTRTKTTEQSKPFDPKSIMMYPVPKELTKGGFEIGFNNHLSEMDKKYIAQLYPR